MPLLNWTGWRHSCKQTTNDARQYCYRIDNDDENGAEPWQELEMVMMERWRDSPLSCNHHATAEECLVNSDVVIVPSPLAHCRTMMNGLKIYENWNPAMVDGRVSAAISNCAPLLSDTAPLPWFLRSSY